MPQGQDSNAPHVIQGGCLPTIEKRLINEICYSADQLALALGARPAAQRLRRLADLVEADA